MSNIDKEAIIARTTPSDLPIDLTSVPMFTSVESVGVPPRPETEAEEFKRMIQERNRDEEELEAAVPFPSGISSSVINSRVNSRANSRAPSITGASGTITPRRDLFSGVSSMKEMFDISYAVHRMTEEKQRRKNIKQSGDTSKNRRSLFMSAVNGDDDDITEDEVDLVTDETSSNQTSEEDGVHELKEKIDLVNINESTPVNEKKIKSNKQHNLFELNMNNATLLGRRKIPSSTQPIDDPVESQQ